MPRMSGRSSLITLSRIRCSPSRRTVSFWSFGRSITLRTWVTLSLVTVDLRQGLGPRGLRPGLRCRDPFEHRLRRHLMVLAFAEPGHVVRLAEPAQPGDRRL